MSGTTFPFTFPGTFGAATPPRRVSTNTGQYVGAARPPAAGFAVTKWLDGLFAPTGLR